MLLFQKNKNLSEKSPKVGGLLGLSYYFKVTDLFVTEVSVTNIGCYSYKIHQ